MAAAGATTLAVAASLLVPVAAAADDDPTTLNDLLISEYVEGSSFNKALEIYNGTNASIDLSAYNLRQFSNGNPTTASINLTLSGTLAPGEVHIVADGQAAPEVLAVADQTVSGAWNGDDALVLSRGEVVVDSLGQQGFDPGTEWGTGLVSTADNTLRRKADVCEGDTTPTDAFDPAVQWDGFATNTFDGLGTHTTTCAQGEPSDPGDPGDPGEPTDPGSCSDEATLIGAVQGSGAASPLAGRTVTVEGTVVGDFQHTDSYDGYYVQDAGDGDPATSDGIFVFGGRDVAVGDRVRVTGPVTEFFGLTEISARDVQVCATGEELPAATELTMPLGDLEPYEGMLVTFPQDLAILEYFEYARFGEIVIGTGDDTFRQHQPTAVHEPGSPEAQALAAHNAASRIMLDDGLGRQNPPVLRHPNGEPFSLDNTFRGGDTVTNATGVLDYRFDQWGLQPTEPADFARTNPRPEVPEVGGTTTVASFNVLNYFTTLVEDDRNARGADDAAEFERQQAKIVAAINEMDTDVVGLIEIENNGDVAVGNLVDALNEAAGEDRWAFVSTGPIGTDVITTAFIYQPAEVTPVGRFETLTSADDPRFDDSANRPALAQTFEDNAVGGQVTVVVNHLKSKGSACAGDPDTGQGNCNLTRARAADALGDWANGDPTGTGAEHAVIIGDLNSYDHEDPIDALRADGFVDLLREFGDEYTYTYVFDGMLGYLDYALASASLVDEDRVTGAAPWNINADEPSVLDYDMTFKPNAQDALYAEDPYRSSDHDPVLVGLDLTPPDTTAPELEVVASPSSVWPPNNKWVTVDTVVDATDDSGAEPTVTLTGAVVTDAGPNGKGDIEVLSDSRVRVVAAVGAVYTLTYQATDAAGNTTTTSVTVEVAKPDGGSR